MVPVVCTYRLSCQAKQLDFAQFIDDFCPADGTLVSKIFFKIMFLQRECNTDWPMDV